MYCISLKGNKRCEPWVRKIIESQGIFSEKHFRTAKSLFLQYFKPFFETYVEIFIPSRPGNVLVRLDMKGRIEKWEQWFTWRLLDKVWFLNIRCKKSDITNKSTISCWTKTRIELNQQLVIFFFFFDRKFWQIYQLLGCKCWYTHLIWPNLGSKFGTKKIIITHILKLCNHSFPIPARLMDIGAYLS